MECPAARAPLGKTLWNAAHDVGRAFDEALSSAGGSRPTWFVLLALKSHQATNQSELAAMVGIRSATLTHHLTAMEGSGLVRRRRDPGNRRVQLVEITESGETAFARMSEAATDYDRKLRDGIGDDEIEQLFDILHRIRANASTARTPDSEHL